MLLKASEWDIDDSDEPLKRVEYFGGLRAIFILLDSYRFVCGHPMTSRQEYQRKAAELQVLDQEVLRGQD